MSKEYDEEEIICGNCLSHRPVWENGKLTGWYCSNHLADAYGCETAYDDCEGCLEFKTKR